MTYVIDLQQPQLSIGTQSSSLLGRDRGMLLLRLLPYLLLLLLLLLLLVVMAVAA
jgi:hypothetical protein